jgi:hypothetical protein
MDDSHWPGDVGFGLSELNFAQIFDGSQGSKIRSQLQGERIIHLIDLLISRHSKGEVSGLGAKVP